MSCAVLASFCRWLAAVGVAATLPTRRFVDEALLYKIRKDVPMSPVPAGDAGASAAIGAVAANQETK
jgi:hypothetical protein